MPEAGVPPAMRDPPKEDRGFRGRWIVIVE
jgi:hypothetical protein